MFIKRKKTESRPGVVRSEGRLLMLFRSGDVSQDSLISLESTEREDLHIEDQRIVRNAMLEGEYHNARALLAFQNNKRFC